MSFFDAIGKGIGKVAKAGAGKLVVIEYDFKPGELVWVYPSRQVPYGSRIVVKPNQAAIVIRSGKVLGVLRQGEWPLDTAHVPGLRGIMSELYEGVPLPVTIIFVNLAEKPLRFGGRGKTADGIPYMYNGQVRIQIPPNEDDIKKFALNIAGEDKSFTTEELEEQVRVFINQKVEGFLARFLYMDLEVGSLQVKQAIEMMLRQELYNNFYLSVKNLAFDIEWPEDIQKMLIERGYATQVALLRSNPQLAQQWIQYDLQRRLIEALGQAGGANVMAGMLLLPQFAQQMLQPMQQRMQQPGTGQPPATGQPPQQPPPGGGAAAPAFFAGVMTGQQAQQPQQPQGPAVPRTPGAQAQQGQAPAGYTPRCPYCGAEIPASLRGSKFCPFCGKQIKWCPNGHVAPAEAKFCPICGAPLE